MKKPNDHAEPTKSNAKKIIWSIKPTNQHEFRSVKTVCIL